MAREHSLIFMIGSKIASNFSPNISKVSKEFSGLNTNLEKFNKTQNDINKFVGLKKSLKEDKEKAELLQSEINKMAKEIKNTEKPTKTLTTAFEMKKKELSQLHDKIDKNSTSLQEYRTSLKDAGINTKNLAQESIKLKESFKEQMKQQSLMNSVADKQERFDILRQKRAEARIQRLNKLEAEREEKRKKFNENIVKAKDYGKDLKGSGEKQLKTGAVQAGIITMGVKLAIDDESAFADVKKTTGLEGVKAEKFRQEIIRATKDIPLMNDEIYNIAAAAGQAGIKQQELTRFTGDAAVMAVAFDQVARDSGDTMATWRTSFGMTQDQVITLGDQVNYLANSVNASASDISEVVNRVGAIGKNAGLSVEQVGALGASLVAMGQEPEVASTAIKNMTGALTKGYAVTKAQAGAYKKLGLDAEKVAQQMQMDGDGTILMVLEKINKINPAEKGALISQLFGDEAKAGVSQLSGQLGLLQDNFNRVADKSKYAGSMMAEYKNRSATTENSLILMAKSTQTVAANMAYAFLPTVREGSKLVIDIAQKIGNFSEKHPKLSKNIGYTVAGLAAFNIVTGASKILLGNTITQGAKLIGFFTAKTVAVGADTVATGANAVAENALYVTKAKSILLTIRKTVATGLHTTAMIGNKVATMGVSAALWVWNTAGLKTLFTTTKNIAVMGAHKAAMIASKIATGAMTAGQWALNVALNANPVGLVVAGVGLLIGAFVIAYKKSEGFREMINSIIDKGKKLLGIFSIFDKNKKSSMEVNISDKTDNFALKATPFAKGGIVSKPTLSMVGEGGDTEVVVPLNNSPRSKSLLEYANKAINGKSSNSGVLANVSSNSQNNTQGITISMPITIQNAGGSIQEAKKYGEAVGKAVLDNLDNFLNKREHDKGRISIG